MYCSSKFYTRLQYSVSIPNTVEEVNNKPSYFIRQKGLSLLPRALSLSLGRKLSLSPTSHSYFLRNSLSLPCTHWFTAGVVALWVSVGFCEFVLWVWAWVLVMVCGLWVVAVGDGWFGLAWFDFLYLWWIYGYGLKI